MKYTKYTPLSEYDGQAQSFIPTSSRTMRLKNRRIKIYIDKNQDAFIEWITLRDRKARVITIHGVRLPRESAEATAKLLLSYVCRINQIESGSQKQC